MGNKICQLNIYGPNMDTDSLNNIGLPTPRTGFVSVIMTNGGYVVGKTEYANNTWTFTKIANAANYVTGYGSNMYFI